MNKVKIGLLALMAGLAVLFSACGGGNPGTKITVSADDLSMTSWCGPIGFADR